MTYFKARNIQFRFIRKDKGSFHFGFTGLKYNQFTFKMSNTFIL